MKELMIMLNFALTKDSEISLNIRNKIICIPVKEIRGN
jgi:hypothetical protein